MKVITVATEDGGYFKSLQESAVRHNYDLIVLGYGMKWGGFGWRVHIILDYLKTLPSNEIIMVVDAYDVILLRDSTELFEEFKRQNREFLCGSFRKLDGILGNLQELEFGNAKEDLTYPYNNICAGTWITYVHVALYLYGNYDIKHKDDDQIILNRMYDDYGKNIVTPDTNFDIFCTLFPDILSRRIKDIDNIIITDDKKIKCGVTNTYPFVLHALGNMYLDDILIKLDYSNYISNTTSMYLLKKGIYHIKLILKILFKIE